MKQTAMREHAVPQLLLIAGVLLAVLAEALTGTALSFGRIDMLGDLYTTTDEFAWLDFGYTAAKLCGFMMVPALFARFKPIRVMQAASFVITVFSLTMLATSSLPPLILIRLIQGMSGGILVVSGQTLLFNVFNGKGQAGAQLVFALGAVVAPATFASTLQGWMVDVLSWEGIFLAATALGLGAIILLAAVPPSTMSSSGPKRTDIMGFFLFAGAAVCLTYIAQEGSRWNWFESPHIVLMTVCGFSILLICVARWSIFSWRHALVNLSVFGNRDFCFGVAVSFVAGVALFGSTWLIPNFTLNVLGLTPTESGALIAPGGVAFVTALLLTALLLSFSRVSPLATVPLGILLLVVGMWLLSGSTSESGSADMLLPLIVRGTGLGFLFLSLIIYTLGGLQGSRIAQGVALFTTLRQFGGLFGVALLQRYLDHQNALNSAVLSSHLEEGGALLAERLQRVQVVLQSKGMEAGAATTKAAVAFLKKSLLLQSNVLSYNEAFFAIVIVFIVAVPVLLIYKFWLSQQHCSAPATDKVSGV